MDIEPASAPLPSRDIYSQMNGCLQAPDFSRCMDFNIEQGQIGILNIKVNIQDPGIATRYFVGFPHPTKSVRFILCGITGMANTDLPPLPPNPTPLFEPIMDNDVLGIWSKV
ncbi:predicted protein [Coccidioides posadasii str. Silveira]|uniref:Predicted protein n=1 Tax=Coccidioides posadasii (strain RMSCC 757 / Silveira) TaxID=443226 RepID=E9DAI3_COCPS|nr:predicted protein [Coccidioides posadasii str. Silveira]